MVSLMRRTASPEFIDVEPTQTGYTTELKENNIKENIVVKGIDHIGSSYRIRFIQEERFCPILHVESTATAYVLLKEGPYAIRLDNETKFPVVAKLEINGKLFRSEYRILPRGSRTIKEVHECLIATTRPLCYYFPKVFDNILHKVVGPSEVELGGVAEAEAFTSLCRVLFLPVRGGAAATRGGLWGVSNKAPVITSLVARVGHTTPLAQLFNVGPHSLSKMRRQASLHRPPTTRAAASSSSSSLVGSHNSYSNYNNFSRNSRSSTPRGRSGSGRRASSVVDRGTAMPPSPFTRLVQSMSSMGSAFTLAPSSSQPRGRRPTLHTPTGNTNNLNNVISHGIKSNATPIENNNNNNIIIKQYQKDQNKKKERPSSPVPNCPILSDVNSSINFKTNTKENSMEVFLTDNLDIDGGSSDISALRSNIHGNENYHICIRCNAAFDRERHMYNEMISSLREQVISLEQEKAQLEARCKVICINDRVQKSEEYKEQYRILSQFGITEKSILPKFIPNPPAINVEEEFDATPSTNFLYESNSSNSNAAVDGSRHDLQETLSFEGNTLA